MENFKVEFDDTVRDASQNIIQFQYGDDGFDAVKIVRLKIPSVLPSYDRYTMDYDDKMAVVREMETVELASHYFEWWKNEIKEELVSCPVDVDSLFEKAKILSEGKSMKMSLNDLWNRCCELISTIDNELFKNYLILFFQMRRMTELNDTLFEWFMEQIKYTYDRAKVHPGEMVGVLAGQSKFSLLYGLRIILTNCFSLLNRH